MMTSLSSALATSAIVRKFVRPRIAGTHTQIEKPGKVTWDESLSLDATTVTLWYYQPLTVTKWSTNGVIIYRHVSRLLILTFIDLYVSYYVLFCILYQKENTNKWYHNTVNNLISPNTVSQNDEKPHTAELDDTAIPHVKIKITEILQEKKLNTAIL